MGPSEWAFARPSFWADIKWLASHRFEHPEIRSFFAFAFIIWIFVTYFFFIKRFALAYSSPKMRAKVWMWTAPTYLELRVTGFWMAGSFFKKGKHGLAHLGHAGNQFGFCGVCILGWEVISVSWQKKSTSLFMRSHCLIGKKNHYCLLFTERMGIFTMLLLSGKQ